MNAIKPETFRKAYILTSHKFGKTAKQPIQAELNFMIT